MIPTSIDGTDITGATIDGTDVQEITVDGDVVFSAAPSNLPVAYSNLVAWYPFDSGTYGGSNPDDVTALFNPSQSGDSTAYDGTVNGASYQSSGGVTDINAGANSGAFSFDGSNDYIEVSSGIINGDSSFTLSVWVNFDTLQDVSIIGETRGNSSGSFDVRYFQSDDDIKASYPFQGTPVDTNQLNFSTNQWFHIAYVRDGGNHDVYIDAILEGSGSGSNFNADGNEFVLGASYTFEDYLDGKLDDARVYNKALSSTEVDQIYQNSEP